jgi:LacI family transcriptional regulator
VVIDDYKGAFNATEHLIQQGYTRIAHISGPQHLKNFHDRMKGYMGALQANKIKMDPDLIYPGNISIESGKTGTEYFLSLSNPPDAIFAVEDFTALGAISKLKERNITIPGQMGIIGFANELFGEHITPSLSTVDHKLSEWGSRH